jgi:hypothetical protein
LIYHEKWWEIALIPFRIFFEGRDDIPRFFDGKLNPALLFLPAFAFFSSSKSKDTEQMKHEKFIWLIYSLLLIIIIYFLTDMRIRYMSPAIPGLVILSIFGLKNTFVLIGKYNKASFRYINSAVLLTVMVICFAPNVFYLAKQFEIVMPYQYLSSKISRDQYIEKFRPEYGVIHYANEFLPLNARILSLFIGKRGYYSNRKMVFDIDVLQSAIQRSDSVEAVRKKLTQQGLTHILIQFDMFKNWCQSNLDGADKQMVDKLFGRKESLIVAKNGYMLFRL